MKNSFFIIKLKKVISIVLFFFVLTTLFICSKINVETIKNTTNLFLYSVFPSLFTFAFFTEFVLNTNTLEIISNKLKKIVTKIFPVSIYSTFAIIIGFLCGFPSGAKAIIKLYEDNKISFKQAEILLSFNNNCNPIFIFVTIGISMFDSKEIGYILLISHFLSSILIGITYSNLYTHNIIHEDNFFLNTLYQKNFLNTKKISIFNNIKLSLKTSFLTLFNIFGFVLIFSLISCNIEFLLNNFISDKNLITLIISNFEITSGISKLILTNYNIEFKIILTSILLGFSGICILFQIYSVIYNKGFSLLKLIYTKIIHGLLSGIICFILIKFNIFNTTKDVFNNFDKTINFNNIASLNKFFYIFFLITLLLIFVVNIFLNKKKKIAK